MSFERITSLQNPRVKHLVRLRDGTHRRRQKLFLIEGLRECERALERGWPLEEFYFCEEDFRDSDASWALVDRIGASGVAACQLSPEAFAKSAYREGPDGILAVAPMRSTRLEDLRLPQDPLILVMEGIEKPGNLGALLRSADAAGVHACLLVNGRTDVYNPNTIRASQGAFFSQTVVSTDSTTARLWLEEQQIPVFAMTPHTAVALWQADLAHAAAIAVGAEDAGLSADWLDEGVQKVALPMRGITDSLNVSTAAAIALFEAVRQREVERP